MTILSTDVKLFESEELSDEDYGGGRQTGIEVIDGQVNNLFQDISRLDRTIGDVSLRKVFVGVDTNNNDSYLGAHGILSKQPIDPRVHVFLFKTEEENDVRSDAVNYIENYLVKSVPATFELLGNQVAGQRTIIGVQRETQDLPEVGEVFVLVFEGIEQYCRATDVEHSIETFYEETTGSIIEFTRRKLIITISDSLANSFPGGSARRIGTSSPKSEVLTTQVVDAAKYYGASKLAADVELGDTVVSVESVFENIVPTAQTENAVLDEPGGYPKQNYKAASTSNLVDAYGSGTLSPSASITVNLMRSPVRGSVTVSTPLGTLEENGDGTLTGPNGLTGVVDYQARFVTISSATQSSASANIASVSYTPAAPITVPAETGSLDVTQATRGYVYNFSFSGAPPVPGSFVLQYLALGKWQVIEDRGDGILEGAGTGSVDFGTGTVTVTLAVLPDADTQILYSHAVNLTVEHMIDEAASASAIAAITAELVN